MNSYENNIRLERKFTKEIKCILGLCFIGQDPIMDKYYGTDFLVFRIEPIKVGVRLRTFQYYKNKRYREQFTIRYKLDSGNRTEIDKIREGLVDYILYGFVDKREEKIIHYFIGDLGVFRKYEKELRAELRLNKDKNPSTLAAYNLKDFPLSFVVKAYPNNIVIKPTTSCCPKCSNVVLATYKDGFEINAKCSKCGWEPGDN